MAENIYMERMRETYKTLMDMETDLPILVGKLEDVKSSLVALYTGEVTPDEGHVELLELSDHADYHIEYYIDVSAYRKVSDFFKSYSEEMDELGIADTVGLFDNIIKFLSDVYNFAESVRAIDPETATQNDYKLPNSLYNDLEIHPNFQYIQHEIDILLNVHDDYERRT